MADELLDLEEGQEQVNKTEKRIKDLSEKVKLTSEERDELVKSKETLEQEKVALSKEVDFFKNFSQMTSKYAGAGDFQEQIKEKVVGGYDVEDATISILAKEGKFIPPDKPAPPRENPAGGSATSTVRAAGEKPISEMTQLERKEALMKAELENGDITRIFSPTNRIG